MANPFGAACLRTYTAIRNSGHRPASAVKWIVLHSTEGPTARGAAEWFTNPNAEGSAHLVIDNDVCYRTLTNLQVPWAAPGANYNGFHIEQAGYARWTRTDWLTHDHELRRVAYKVALHAKLFKIPLRWVGPVGLRLGRRGLTTHRAVSYAWPLLARKWGFHTDPGLGYPRDRVLAYARGYLTLLTNT